MFGRKAIHIIDSAKYFLNNSVTISMETLGL